MEHSTIPMRTNPSYVLRRKEDVEQGKATKEDRQYASIGTWARVIVVALVLLLSITLASIALSITSYS